MSFCQLLCLFQSFYFLNSITVLISSREPSWLLHQSDLSTLSLCTAPPPPSSCLMTWVLSDVGVLVHRMTDSQGQGCVLPIFVSPGPGAVSAAHHASLSSAMEPTPGLVSGFTCSHREGGQWHGFYHPMDHNFDLNTFLELSLRPHHALGNLSSEHAPSYSEQIHEIH